MARLLFEMQAVRTRRGPLAAGTEFVVYIDAAGTVLADISATSGGSSIAGSTVTVTDIPGLGPSALQFYGPPDNTEVLYLRCPSDASLGVQELEADVISGGGGTHPNLATHDAIGLATQTELDNTKDVIYVKEYVPAPDGTTDNTAALASAVAAAAGKVLSFETGKTYVQNAALEPASNTTIRGNGATLKAGSSKTGALSTHGRQIHILTKTDITIEGLKFPAPASAFSTAESEQATIWIGNSVRCRVTDNSLVSTLLGSGIFIGGVDSRDNRIERNYLSAAGGIVYSYAGADRTVCRDNLIISPSANALSGTGNAGPDYNEYCLVEGNRVEDVGRMGIEDWTACRGTVIRNNTILVSDDFGISIPCSGPTVEGNTILDPTGYGIEAFSGGVGILDNKIRWVDGTPGVGIFVGAGGTDALKGGRVIGNYVEGAEAGVELNGAIKSVTVMGNTIVNPVTYGIRCNTSSGHVAIIGNTVRWTDPIAATSTGITTSNASAVVIGNTLVCESAISTGTAGPLGIRPLADYTVIEGNVFDGAGVTGAAQFYALATLGGGPTGVRFCDNIILGGAIVDITSMVAPLLSRNTGSVSGVNSREGFYGVTPVARASIVAAAGDPATTQTLANDLRTKLIALGLVT